MSSYAALGVVRAGVAVLKGTGVRIKCTFKFLSLSALLFRLSLDPIS
jgi:hypothetical protein